MLKTALLVAVLFAALAPLASTTRAAEAKPLNGLANSITIYVYPPRNPIDWSTPGRALTTTAGNLLSAAFTENSLVQFFNGFHERDSISSLYRSGIGHTLNHVQCVLPSGEKYDHWASLTGQNYHAIDTQLLLKDQVGVGVLFYNFVDGLILTGAENWERIAFYDGDGWGSQKIRPRYIQMEITPEQCDEARKMIAFFETFHYAPDAKIEDLAARPSEKILYFTNNIDPYDSYQKRMSTGHGNVGGGCAPFAAALAKITGRYTPELDPLWRRTVTVSEKLMGGWKDSGGRVHKVSLGALLLTPLGFRWDYTNEGYRNHYLSLYDPQKIWDFTGEMLDCIQHGNCAVQDRGFYRNHRLALAVGTTQVFRSKYTQLLSDPAGGDPVKDIHPVRQPVQGIVWKLEK
jgi:hypothetical protein